MALFSQRKGFKPLKTAIQSESIDEPLRNGLWDAIKIFIIDSIVNFYDYKTTFGSEWKRIPLAFWRDYLKKPLDTMPGSADDFVRAIRPYFFKCEWYEVYDLIELILNEINKTSSYQSKKFIDYCNYILKREVSAYRIIGNKVTEITAEEEISEIEQALETPFSAVNSHLKTALDYITSRKSPDYRNSIKESISAVEAICKIIVKDEKATLSEALKKIEEKIEIHSALKKAFNNLYGYTSDEKGIRHSLLEKSDLDFEDAKFMLVSCSAFINYLKSKAMKSGSIK